MGPHLNQPSYLTWLLDTLQCQSAINSNSLRNHCFCSTFPLKIIPGFKARPVAVTASINEVHVRDWEPFNIAFFFGSELPITRLSKPYGQPISYGLWKPIEYLWKTYRNPPLCRPRLR